jgi:hypothetical protein
VVVRRGQIRKIEWVIKTLEAQVRQFLLRCKCPVSRFLPGRAKDLSAPLYSCTLPLASALDGVGGQRHAPAALLAGKRSGTHCIGGWVNPKAGLDGCGDFRPHRDPITGPSRP